VALMSEAATEPVRTFSVGFEGDPADELPAAREVARRFGARHTELTIRPDLQEILPRLAWSFDEPFADSSALPSFLVCEIARRSVTVALNGDGGDENFAGYDRFAGNRLVDIYCLVPRWFRESVMKKITERIPESFSYKSFAQKAAWANEMSLFAHGERYAQSMCFLRFTAETKEKLFTAAARKKIDDRDSVAKILAHFDSENVDHLVDRMLYTDLMTRMPDHLLALVDRMAMAHSLETRSPLIDYRVVEYAASIPAEMKLKGKNLKYILKKVAQRYLPGELIHREKQGFGFPLGIWMRNELRVLLETLFAESRFVREGIFTREYLDCLLREHLSGKRNHDFRLWILMNLEIWYRMYFENENVDSMKEYIKRISSGTRQ